MSGDALAWAWRQIREKKELTVGQRFVLSSIADEAASDGLFFIGYKRVAEKCVLDRDFVRQAFRRFRDQGLIEVYSWKRDDGSYTVNGYRLTIELPYDKDNLQYILNRFRNEVGKEGKFVGVLRMGDKGATPRRGMGQGTLPYGSRDPGLWIEEPSGVVPGAHPTGLGKPEVRVAQPSGGMGQGTHSSPDPIPVPDREPLTVSIPISSGRGKLVGAGADYFRSIQSLLGQLPGVHVNVLNPRIVGQLYRRSVPFSVIEAACWLSVARAQKAPDDFTEIKSFRYFQPCIEEILQSADKAILRQAAFCRLRLLGDAATDEDRQAFEALYGK